MNQNTLTSSCLFLLLFSYRVMATCEYVHVAHKVFRQAPKNTAETMLYLSLYASLTLAFDQCFTDKTSFFELPYT